MVENGPRDPVPLIVGNQAYSGNAISVHERSSPNGFRPPFEISLIKSLTTSTRSGFCFNDPTQGFRSSLDVLAVFCLS